MMSTPCPTGFTTIAPKKTTAMAAGATTGLPTINKTLVATTLLNDEETSERNEVNRVVITNSLLSSMVLITNSLFNSLINSRALITNSLLNSTVFITNSLPLPQQLAAIRTPANPLPELKSGTHIPKSGCEYNAEGLVPAFRKSPLHKFYFGCTTILGLLRR
jgi:hypothetical protein